MLVTGTHTVHVTGTYNTVMQLYGFTSGGPEGGGWGFKPPQLKKGVHYYCLVIEQKQWLIIKIVATRCVVF